MRILFLLGVALSLIFTPAVFDSSGGKALAKGKVSYAPKTVKVKGYVKKNGTFVSPHRRASPRR